MKNIIKKFTILLPTLACLLFFAGIASAHVTVKPNVSAPGAWETYTIKIPVEKEIPTTKVTLKIPKGMEFQQYQPVPEWKVNTDKDSSGKVTNITWEATGEGIMPGQFQQFSFVAKNPASEEQAAWDAYQYYKDGTIVEWTGNEKSQNPHSITEITTAEANTVAPKTNEDHPSQANTKENSETNKTESDSNSISTITLILSIIALLVSITAFVMARKKK